ncbi:hypothetical protein [Micromonospora robiginosa]|uniref:Uncharacterized protein n=1 Tax=Micromonospora robiginosa TaxID=2749844 RepID=A0A7L6B466_9ACTN|nr:hypothetical protein [Micromonospora ferruginea]QLQ36694.1 hypothetical protein H1D33_26095 [Micromonospora ferruginea]
MTDTSPDHIPAHVKNSYVNCSEYARTPRLTPLPSVGDPGATAPSARPPATVRLEVVR